jgi:hypothetical protein
MNQVDLSWAHPALAKNARRIFRNVRQDSEGRLCVTDMKNRFQRHAMPMLDDIEIIGGREWAYFDDNWRTVLKDWGMCVGIDSYCTAEG